MKPIIFVLGKPGCGKGTVCAYLSAHMRVQHFSAGELLRKEAADPNSPDGRLIQEDMLAGRIVKPEITVMLLKKAMQSSDADGFLIDGFPREPEQFEYFRKVFGERNCSLMHLECPDEECIARVKGRKQGRSDDNDKTLKARLENFNQQTLKVIKYFTDLGKAVAVNSNQGKDAMCAEAEERLAKYLGWKAE